MKNILSLYNDRLIIFFSGEMNENIDFRIWWS